VLKGIQKGMNLPIEAVLPSFASLRDMGNTSSSTTWYSIAYLETQKMVTRGQTIMQVRVGDAQLSAAGPQCRVLVEQISFLCRRGRVASSAALLCWLLPLWTCMPAVIIVHLPVSGPCSLPALVTNWMLLFAAAAAAGGCWWRHEGRRQHLEGAA
jgi:hypothetical protein